MGIGLVLALCAVPFLIGCLYERITGAGRMSLTGIYCAGCVLMLAAAGIAAMPAVKFRTAYSSYRMVASALLGVLALCGAFPAGRRLLAAVRDRKKGKSSGPGLWMLAAALFAVSASVFFTGEPATAGDITAETIVTAVESDTMFEYHPMTGEPLELGIYPADKLTALPLIYGIGYRMSGMGMRDYLYRLIPLWVLSLNYMIAGQWAGLLFGGREEEKTRKRLFFIFYGLFHLFGDYLFITYSYKLLHETWTGETVLIAVILPYLGYLCMELFMDRTAVLRNLPLIACCLLTAVFAAPVREAAMLCGLTLAAFAVLAAVRRVRHAVGH